MSVKKRRAKPKLPSASVNQVLYRLDHGRLATIRSRLDAISMGQHEIICELGSVSRRVHRINEDCQAALTNLLHRIIALETPDRVVKP